jgi:hypothetical protein
VSQRAGFSGTNSDTLKISVAAKVIEVGKITAD